MVCPCSNLLALGSGRGALGQDTLSPLCSPSERTFSRWSPGCLLSNYLGKINTTINQTLKHGLLHSNVNEPISEYKPYSPTMLSMECNRVRRVTSLSLLDNCQA